MDLLFIMVLFFVSEYIGDFLLQDRNMAENKSENLGVLLKHVLCVSGTIMCFMGAPMTLLYGLAGLKLTLETAVLYGLIHGVQDFLIWNIYKYIRRDKISDFFAWWEDKLFYDFIGFDRLLHVITGITLLLILI